MTRSTKSSKENAQDRKTHSHKSTRTSYAKHRDQVVIDVHLPIATSASARPIKFRIGVVCIIVVVGYVLFSHYSTPIVISPDAAMQQLRDTHVQRPSDTALRIDPVRVAPHRPEVDVSPIISDLPQSVELPPMSEFELLSIPTETKIDPIDPAPTVPSASRPKSLSAAELAARAQPAIDALSTPRPATRAAVGAPPPPPVGKTSTGQIPSVFIATSVDPTKPKIEHPPTPKNVPMFVEGFSPIRPVVPIGGGIMQQIVKPMPLATPVPIARPQAPAAPPAAPPLPAIPSPVKPTSNAPSSSTVQDYSHLLESNPRSLLKSAGTLPWLPLDAKTDSVHPSSSTLQVHDHAFSRVQCIGDRNRVGTADDTSCRFKNLCFDLERTEWIFYRDPTEQNQPLVTMDFSTIQTDFPRPLLNLRGYGLVQDAKYWSPTLLSGLIPTEGTFWPKRSPNEISDATQSSSALFLLYHPFYASNLGHVLGDDLWPMFNLMESFGVLSNQVQLLSARSCQQMFPQSKKAATCDKMLKLLPKGISPAKDVVFMNDLAVMRQSLGVPEGSKRICFEHLLAGLSPFAFQQSLGRADQWRKFHSFYLRNFHLSPTYTPRKQRIVVSIKDGKRGYANTGELIQHLKSTFGGMYEVHALELRQLGSWENELSYLLDTSVLITPCGAVSMSAMFLPKGAAMIIVDYWSVKRQASVGMEEKLWANLGYIRPFHYPFVESEVILPEKGPWDNKLSRSSHDDMRGYGMVHVNLDRMTDIVRSALDHTKNFMTFGQD